jgi:hypothetical protein
LEGRGRKGGEGRGEERKQRDVNSGGKEEKVLDLQS